MLIVRELLGGHLGNVTHQVVYTQVTWDVHGDGVCAKKVTRDSQRRAREGS